MVKEKNPHFTLRSGEQSVLNQTNTNKGLELLVRKRLRDSVDCLWVSLNMTMQSCNKTELNTVSNVAHQQAKLSEPTSLQKTQSVPLTMMRAEDSTLMMRRRVMMGSPT